MGNELSTDIAIEQAFGETKEDAVKSLNASIRFKYNSRLIIAGDRHGYMYGGELLAVKYEVLNGITRAYVDLK